MIEDSIPSLGDALIAFQSSRKGGQQQEGGQYLNGFIQWCGRERDVRELTPPEVASYVERYAYSGSSAKTQANCLASLQIRSMKTERRVLSKSS